MRARPTARFIERLLEILLLEIRGQLLVKPRGGRVAREIQNVRQVVAAREFERLEVQDR